MRIFPFFYCLTMRFQHGSYKGEEDELSLQTVSVAKSSWWQGEIHSSLCCFVFRDSNPKSWEFLLLCELEIAEQQQLKTWQLWSNSNPGGILEFTLRWDVPKWKVFFWGCLCSKALPCFEVSNNHRKEPKFGFFLLWCNQEQESLGWFCVGAETPGQTLKSVGRKWGRGTWEESWVPCCSCQSFGGLAGLKTGIK